MSRSWLGLGIAAVMTVASSGRAATPPAGFQDTQIVDGTSATGANTPTAVAYEPGTGALFVTEQGDGTSSGTARVRRRDVNGNVTTAVTISCVDSVNERGLLGIAVDPDYTTAGHRYVYLYFTRHVDDPGGACAFQGLPAGGYNNVVRYTESGGALTGQQVLLVGPHLGANNHDGGALRFAADKTLFISMGDNATASQPLPAARDLNDLRGKILRINRDGSIPASNPYYGQSGKRGEIWAWGLRNPFRMSFDSQSGRLYIADVGEDTYEEVDIGVSGGDFGWPCFEANAAYLPCTPPPTADIKPIYYYGHGSQTPPVSGDTIIGGPVYRAAAFPAAYRNRYFFGDWAAGWIRSAAVGPNGGLSDVQMFMPDASSVVDIVVSPAGCLTWVNNSGQGVHNACSGAIVADWDGSGRVDGIDLAALGRAFGAAIGDPRYDATLDFTQDGVIDGDDLAVLASEFGLSVGG
ncbi:MAG TPA: PQQ-dependent sugar dehydrogenase [Candidatus Polarisedimenticolaceae bacterium]|nr:PQQ-dependent sugar dehydrogenase [Candidatus Polarisedimenticolaceae bacterium]